MYDLCMCDTGTECANVRVTPHASIGSSSVSGIFLYGSPPYSLKAGSLIEPKKNSVFELA